MTSPEIQTAETIANAIAKRLCIAATYNNDAVTLAPHVLFTLHDAWFASAVTVERNGAPPKMVKLGTYRLVGLKDLTATTRGFTPMNDFVAPDAEFNGVVVAVVEK